MTPKCYIPILGGKTKIFCTTKSIKEKLTPHFKKAILDEIRVIQFISFCNLFNIILKKIKKAC